MPRLVALVLWGIASFSTATSLRAQSWERVEQIPSTYIYAILAHEGALYAASDSVLYVSDDQGRTWSPVVPPADVTPYFSALLGVGPSVYLGSTNRGAFVSRDGGTSWQRLTNGLGQHGVSGFALLGDSLYAATDDGGVFVLDLNDPTRWYSYNQGLPYVGITAIGTSPSHIVAGAGAEGHVYVRERSGAVWETAPLDTLGQQVWSIVSVGDYVFVGADEGVYRGTHDGRAWEKVGIDLLAGLLVPTLVHDGDRLYAGVRFQGEHFVCYSDDEGATWNVIAHEFAELDELMVANDRLWAARGDGLWYLPLRGGTPVDPLEALAEPHLGQNAPNPFTDATRIPLVLARPSVASLHVYDVTGRRVATLLDGAYLGAGPHVVPFAAPDLPNGTYFYHLLTDAGAAARMMIHVR